MDWAAWLRFNAGHADPHGILGSSKVCTEAQRRWSRRMAPLRSGHVAASFAVTTTFLFGVEMTWKYGPMHQVFSPGSWTVAAPLAALTGVGLPNPRNLVRHFETTEGGVT